MNPSPVALTNAQARRFLLRLHGLLGEPVFSGKEGVLAFVRQCGCIQFDPIDTCGKNAELVLQSRVEGFSKQMLHDLLYKDRLLVDYFDKQLAILSVEDWPYFARERARHTQDGRSREAANMAADAVRMALEERECICSRDLDMNEKVSWYWTDTRLGRAVLETLYFRGELGVHHKEGATKHYAPIQRLLPDDILRRPDPFADDDALRCWQTLRRIGAVGLLRGKASDAFLGIDHREGRRERAFEALLDAGDIFPVQIEGDADLYYARERDRALLREVIDGAAYAPRTELIAPLDNLTWDRKLIQRLFGFAYSWEIYTPQAKRQYGYYVLPILHGEAFVGRVEAVADRRAGVLRVRGLWWEGKPYRAALRKCLRRFAAFNGCKSIEGF